jgi:hypothetical protein
MRLDDANQVAVLEHDEAAAGNRRTELSTEILRLHHHTVA